ncbi:UdgX family uracil-DNA binding protein [Microbacterium sediminis]|uniref:Type-4 uracil-DNA glycosylase n=1 Tax=Microbacterium sediminis TaxID=904291 RepID=A0A1B9N9B7_9MICO|nr:UdgX family uracil-DNA binding protein [Microbacterium sediminis]OCG73180.1 uracil-DNA glycosylase [Microbacterium sediminis]QBR74528.1 uracil-DNA glycosylase [Microbacterium sediminis]
MSPADEERPGAEEWVPRGATVERLRAAVDECRGCELWRDATQAVFSRGEPDARIMLVGEQPGDREDREGAPFVGPAGRVVDDALGAAGVPADGVYRTNAVKHFRFERRGKRRIHEKPGVAHVVACRPWLEEEIAAVRPEVIVALGATAARAVLGRPVTIGEVRGTVMESSDPSGTPTVVTAHPSSILRVRDETDRRAAFAQLVDDLRRAAEVTG